MSLAERIQLKTTFLRSRLSQYRQRVIIQYETVRIVIAYQYPMSAAEIHKLRVEFLGSRSPGRHVRIIRPHYLHPAQIHPLQSLEIRPPTVLLAKIICHDLSLHKLRRRRICRISRVRHKNLVALVKKGQRNQQDRLLGAHKRLDLLCRIQCHSIPTSIPIGKRLPELRKSHIALVCMVSRLRRTLAQRLDRRHRRHAVRRTYAQIDDKFLPTFLSFGIHRRYFLKLPRKVVLLHTLRPLRRLYDHIAATYSPKTFRSSINGLTAATACSYLT